MIKLEPNIGLGPTISFLPKQASLHLEDSFSGPERRAISLTVDLDGGEDVRTPEGRSLRSAEWTVLLEETESFNEGYHEGEIGYLSHGPESTCELEGCHIEAHIHRETFTSLLETLQAGRMPDWVNVKVKGLTYGWEPDGTGKVWDISANANVPVLELTVRIPLAAAPVLTTSEGEDEHVSHFPATSAHVKALGDNLLSVMKDQHRSVKMLAALVLVLLLVLLFR
ncbi:MAG: hypothetical protein ACREA0_02720 [bacterium]